MRDRALSAEGGDRAERFAFIGGVLLITAGREERIGNADAMRMHGGGAGVVHQGVL